jgi:hypothetical protein
MKGNGFSSSIRGELRYMAGAIWRMSYDRAFEVGDRPVGEVNGWSPRKKDGLVLYWIELERKEELGNARRGKVV